MRLKLTGFFLLTLLGISQPSYAVHIGMKEEHLDNSKPTLKRKTIVVDFAQQAPTDLKEITKISAIMEALRPSSLDDDSKPDIDERMEMAFKIAKNIMSKTSPQEKVIVTFVNMRTYGHRDTVSRAIDLLRKTHGLPEDSIEDPYAYESPSDITTPLSNHE